MKLVTFLAPDATEPSAGLAIDGSVYDASTAATVVGAELPHDSSCGLAALLAAGDSVLDKLTAAERAIRAGRAGVEGHSLSDVRLHAPIPRPGKILCVAANYREHVREAKRVELKEKEKTTPWFFLKPSNSVVGPDEPIRLPRLSDKVDWELELGIVIGKPGRYIDPERVSEHIAGYTIVNDVSARSVNMPESREERNWDPFFDWLHGKWFDTFTAMGPYLVTPDETGGHSDLDITLKLNGATHQDGSTAQMIFTVEELLAFISQFTTLEAGDVIATGTPAGVGKASGTFLQPGDVLEGSIEGLGVLRNPVAHEQSK